MADHEETLFERRRREQEEAAELRAAMQRMVAGFGPAGHATTLEAIEAACAVLERPTEPPPEPTQPELLPDYASAAAIVRDLIRHGRREEALEAFEVFRAREAATAPTRIEVMVYGVPGTLVVGAHFEVPDSLVQGRPIGVVPVGVRLSYVGGFPVVMLDPTHPMASGVRLAKSELASADRPPRWNPPTTPETRL